MAPEREAAFRGFVVFVGVFEGGFGKSGVSGWFFCGQRVVNCVVKMASEKSLFGERKLRRFLNFIFAGLAGAF